MDRAEALRVLVKKVQDGWSPNAQDDAVLESEAPDVPASAIWGALCDRSVDALATQEFMLRERGWLGPWIRPPVPGEPSFCSHWTKSTTDDGIAAAASKEPRARLLAVLLCKLWEVENADPR